MRSILKKARSSSPEFVHEAARVKIDRPQLIRQDGKPAFAVLPIADWERIVDALDDLEDIFFLEHYQADPDEELLPAEMVYALLDGENQIRVWREHRGLSQQQLTEAAGISKPYLSQLEAGKREASQRVIKRLAKGAARRHRRSDLHRAAGRVGHVGHHRSKALSIAISPLQGSRFD